MRRTELRSRYRNTGPSHDVVEAVLERDQYSCFICGVGLGPARGRDFQIHHRRARRSGGSQLSDTNLPQNLLTLDPDCHARIERERTAAYEGGWLVRQQGNPLEVEVLRHALEWVLLKDDGTVEVVRQVTP